MRFPKIDIKSSAVPTSYGVSKVNGIGCHNRVAELQLDLQSARVIEQPCAAAQQLGHKVQVDFIHAPGGQKLVSRIRPASDHRPVHQQRFCQPECAVYTVMTTQKTLRLWPVLWCLMGGDELGRLIGSSQTRLVARRVVNRLAHDNGSVVLMPSSITRADSRAAKK
jgi:hypothetical protein